MVSPRWTGRLCKIELIFLLGASYIFLSWTFSVAFFQLNPFIYDGNRMLHGHDVPSDMLSSFLMNFTLDDISPTRGSYPIYIADDVVPGKFAVIDWDKLSSKWDSNSSYTDLLEDTTQVVDIRSSTKLQSNTPERIIFILHNHPKMASTTLRRACWENLRSTCEVVSPKRDPMGYSNSKHLASLIDKCDNTHHFCVMGWHFNPSNFPNVTTASSQPINFIHLFPFRNFGDWAESAMKQVFVGHSEAGCDAAAKRLERCDGWLELDFAKYSKQALAQMLGIVKPLGQEQSHAHHLLLYDYSQVQSTLAQLSRLYNVPMLSHLDLRHKETRQDGTCSGTTLKKFHDCFDEQLNDL